LDVIFVFCNLLALVYV